jgi:hypothetical protein
LGEEGAEDEAVGEAQDLGNDLVNLGHKADGHGEKGLS